MTMTEHLTPPLLCKALADETRARIALLVAREGELCVCELVGALGESQPKVSRHLAQLMLDSNRHWLDPQARRLAGMSERPGRASLCG